MTCLGVGKVCKYKHFQSHIMQSKYLQYLNSLRLGGWSFMPTLSLTVNFSVFYNYVSEKLKKKFIKALSMNTHAKFQVITFINYSEFDFLAKSVNITENDI